MQDKIDDKAGYTGKKEKGYTIIFSNINKPINTTNYNTKCLTSKTKLTVISTLHVKISCKKRREMALVLIS